jgi:hypothetical protein
VVAAQAVAAHHLPTTPDGPASVSGQRDPPDRPHQPLPLWRGLRDRLQAWQDINANPVVLDWLKNGVTWTWLSNQPPAPFHFKNRPFTEDENEFLRSELQRCFATGAWEPATSADYVSPCHVVPKPHGRGFRLVVDLRHLNATVHNRQLVRLNSERHEPRTGAVDAFSQDWTADVNWLNPPWRLLPHVIDKLIREPARATLLVPLWPSQPWWPRLVSVASSVLLLPSNARVFRHGNSALPEPLRNRFWRVLLVHVDPSSPQLSWAQRAHLFSRPPPIELPGDY